MVEVGLIGLGLTVYIMPVSECVSRRVLYYGLHYVFRCVFTVAASDSGIYLHESSVFCRL